MTSIAEIVDSLGGFAQKQQLVKRGARDSDLTRAVRSGSVIRARQGWYTTLPAYDRRVRAVRVGGRLTGISAIQQLGGWVLGERPLHVSVADNAARLRSQRNRRVRFDVTVPDGVVLHWDTRELGERGTSWSVSLMDALYRAVLDEPFEAAVAAVDWALRTGRLDPFDLELLLLRLPDDFARIRSWVDAKCDSLPESLARTRLRQAGHHVASQVVIATGKPVDLVVDGCVGVETDGEQFHRDSFDADRHKDAEIALDHLAPFRPSANMVFTEWNLVQAAVTALVAAHLVSPGNSGLLSRVPVRIPGSARQRRLRPRKSPEFPVLQRE